MIGKHLWSPGYAGKTWHKGDTRRCLKCGMRVTLESNRREGRRWFSDQGTTIGPMPRCEPPRVPIRSEGT